MAFITTRKQSLAEHSSVWVIDDDEDDRLFIQSAFADMTSPVSVLTLTDGDQLLPSLTQSDSLPRLILMDINMNRQNGFETLSQLRSTPLFSQLPVVMLTTSSNTDDCQRSLALGASQCLIKPNSYSQLVDMAKNLTERWALA